MCSRSSINTCSFANLLLFLLTSVPVFGQQSSISIAIPDTVVWATETLSASVTATDGTGSLIPVEMTQAPSGAAFDQVAGVFTWLAGEPQIGEFEFSAIDGQGNVITAQLLVLARGELFPGSGSEFLSDALKQVYSPSQTLGYDIALDSMYAVLDLEEDGFVRGIYSGFGALLTQGDPSTVMFNAGINAEHIWPQSKGASAEPQKSDLYHLAPVKSNVDSARSNKPFLDIPDSETVTWFWLGISTGLIPQSNIDEYSESTPGKWEPRESVKGDVARAVMYFRVIYPEVADASFFNSMLVSLITWSGLDEVNLTEVRRALNIREWQGNLNPFILDPNLTIRILGPGPVSVEDSELPDPQEISVFPNPARQLVNVVIEQPNSSRFSEVRVYDVLGRLIGAEVFSPSGHRSATIDVSGYAPGVYFITVAGRASGTWKKLIVM